MQLRVQLLKTPGVFQHSILARMSTYLKRKIPCTGIFYTALVKLRQRQHEASQAYIERLSSPRLPNLIFRRLICAGNQSQGLLHASDHKALGSNPYIPSKMKKNRRRRIKRRRIRRRRKPMELQRNVYTNIQPVSMSTILSDVPG
ncbi:uncharacterized protein RHO17_005864 isoform 1-T1 [Thomomys bottae]